jgi:heme-degrading monooxygenase HmoA
MHARVVTVQSNPDKIDETTRIYRDSVVPAASQQPGFKGAILLNAQDGSGKGISITLWETEADLEAGESSGYYQEQIDKFKGVFTAAPVRETFEVAVQNLTPEKAPIA